MATLINVWEHMEKGGKAVYKGREYYVSMDVLLKCPYGTEVLFELEMLEGGWETVEEIEI